MGIVLVDIVQDRGKVVDRYDREGLEPWGVRHRRMGRA